MLRYRFLFEQMVRRELRQRYKGSALGIVWYLINPLALMAAYGLIFSVLLKSPVAVHDYLLFLFVGLIVWTFFSQALLAAASSLVDHASLVGKVRFPRQTVPASAVTVQLVTFTVLLALVTPIAIAVRGANPALLLLPPVVACLFCFALGLGLIVAVAHAHFRDVQPVLAAALLPWFFLTPIFFRVSDLPGLSGHRWAETVLRWVNPVAPFIEAVRAPLYDSTAPSAATLAYVLVAAAVALGAGLLVFRRFERELAVVL